MQPQLLIPPSLTGEGFNLRRDVHVRAATLLRLLQEQSVGGTSDWVLVLPPWPRLYHWRSASRDRVTFVPWAKFFDLPSLNLFVPTIEFDQYLQRNGHTIDEVGTKGLIFREGLNKG